MNNELHSEIDNILKNDVVERHSFFQLKYFVVGKEPTVQSKLRRCLLELKNRKKSIEAIKNEIEDETDRKSLLEIDLEKNYSIIKKNDQEKKIKKRMLERKRNALAADISSLQEKLQYAEEEAAFFLKAFQDLNKKEELKPFDDLDSQKEYWDEKLSQEMRLRATLRLPCDVQLVQSVLALHNDSPIKQELIQNLERLNTLSDAKLPEPDLEIDNG